MTIWYKSKKAGNTHSTCKNAYFGDIIDLSEHNVTILTQNVDKLKFLVSEIYKPLTRRTTLMDYLFYLYLIKLL